MFGVERLGMAAREAQVVAFALSSKRGPSLREMEHTTPLPRAVAEVWRGKTSNGDGRLHAWL